MIENFIQLILDFNCYLISLAYIMFCNKKILFLNQDFLHLEKYLDLKLSWNKNL